MFNLSITSLSIRLFLCLTKRYFSTWQNLFVTKLVMFLFKYIWMGNSGMEHFSIVQFLNIFYDVQSLDIA